MPNASPATGRKFSNTHRKSIRKALQEKKKTPNIPNSSSSTVNSKASTMASSALNLASLPNDILLLILDELSQCTQFQPLLTLSLVTWHLRFLVAPRIFRTYAYYYSA
jgi:hypothetical protein